MAKMVTVSVASGGVCVCVCPPSDIDELNEGGKDLLLVLVVILL